MSGQNIIFVDGESSSQIEELARYIGGLKEESNVDSFVSGLGGSAEAVLKASLGGVLAKAPEDKLEAVYNQLFAVVAGAEDASRSTALGAATKAIVDDLSANSESGVGALRVLNNLYNLLAVVGAEGKARSDVFEGMVSVAARAQLLGTLVPLVSRLPSMLGEWGVAAEDKARILLALRTALDAAALSNEAYEAEVVFLEVVGAEHERSAEVASSAIVRFANLLAICDIDALASLASVQELNKRGALGDAGAVLNALLSSDFGQWAQFAADKAGALKALGVDAERAADKVRLLTVASVAAENLGQDVPFGVIAKAIGIDEDDVELWIIDVIRAGLIQGKMNQVARTVLPTRSTYRTFGADQWELLAERLSQWKKSLEELQPVVNNAKLIAQQQAMQMAGQSRVTIKE
ncbi:hypothetical protein BX661DRAFT_185325 [Kickxella alabastrina]|uniref:uncharacterized protein n=1 Tax=Kickxella alabastrina TaxID=61397 RepID=UPI00221E7183|nr:uncharacterized protein BX661DRAFT_185325 [Kickxella alabastrina]KAI7824438.1 hypothetical protein BX661DRAFT_185325 [Kickxella alabastrina]